MAHRADFTIPGCTHHRRIEAVEERRRRRGYRMLADVLRREGYCDNLKRIHRVYREEKLQLKVRKRRKTAR